MDKVINICSAKAIARKHTHLSSAINELSLKLPFNKESNKDLAKSILIHLIKNDKNNEINLNEEADGDNNNNNNNEFKLNWYNLCNRINNELWPELSSLIKSIILNKNNKININDINNNTINKIFNLLNN